ncbi:hypothetical protein MKW94_016903 [Papaver nudicaule]|uniref:YGGT family protein n=1 Tax=Papaver nudicaule TaxID=74823 RepID=A0AA41S7G7_PAPNU|nr:hypothetical protein [Papaver nudicaule]
MMAASKTPLLLRNPRSYPLLRSNQHIITHSHINYPIISLKIKPQFPYSNLTHSIQRFRVSASSSPSTDYPPISKPKTNSILSDSITSICAIALTLSKLFQGVLKKMTLTPPTPEELMKLQNMKENLVCLNGLIFTVLLSWFPNIPWDRQPLSAIRDLCDPYLNLFRNIIPPIFDTLDVSPLLAFAVLGVLGSILNNSRECIEMNRIDNASERWGFL